MTTEMLTIIWLVLVAACATLNIVEYTFNKGDKKAAIERGAYIGDFKRVIDWTGRTVKTMIPIQILLAWFGIVGFIPIEYRVEHIQTFRLIAIIVLFGVEICLLLVSIYCIILRLELRKGENNNNDSTTD